MDGRAREYEIDIDGSTKETPQDHPLSPRNTIHHRPWSHPVGWLHAGSEAIGSSKRFIGHVRLNRFGASWHPTRAHNVLNLRSAGRTGYEPGGCAHIDEISHHIVYRSGTPAIAGQREDGLKTVTAVPIIAPPSAHANNFIFTKETTGTRPWRGVSPLNSKAGRSRTG